MSSSSAATETELEEALESLASSSYGSPLEESLCTSDDGLICYLRTSRRKSKPGQWSSSPLASPGTASTGTTTPMARLEPQPPFSNTRSTVLADVVEDIVTQNSANPSFRTLSASTNPSTPERSLSTAVEEPKTPPSSIPSYNTSAGNTTPSTPERRASYPERHRRLASLATLAMKKPPPGDTSPNSSASTGSNLSAKQRQRKERIMFEEMKAKLWASSPQYLAKYVHQDRPPHPTPCAVTSGMSRGSCRC